MDKKTYALRGIIVHTPDFNTIEYHENEYVVCEDGVSKGIFKELPEEYREIPVIDYKDKFIIPGMCDMHVHAPQYGFRGIGMLLDCNSEWETWFDKYSFPEESRYADIAYAKRRTHALWMTCSQRQPLPGPLYLPPSTVRQRNF